MAGYLAPGFTVRGVLLCKECSTGMIGGLSAQLKLVGTPVGGNDLLIAAQAKALGCTVVTDNEREFGRVDGLVCGNWLRGS